MIAICLCAGLREIKALAVKCNASVSSEEYCDWQGTYGALEEHTTTKCDFTLLSCPNWCDAKDEEGQEMKFRRKALQDHLLSCPRRIVNCELCGERGRHSYITKRHEEKCPMKVISCKNSDCSSTMPRSAIKRHLKECDYSKISCKYAKLGCDMKMQRKDMPVHEKDAESHICMSLDTIAKLQDKLDKQKEGKGSITFRITSFSDLKENGGVFVSPPFYSHRGGYCLVAEMFFLVDNSNPYWRKFLWGLHPGVVEGDYDDQLMWPVQGVANFTVLNQDADRDHITESVTFSLVRKKDPYGNNEPEYKSVPTMLSSATYLRDDTLYVKVHVELNHHKSWLQVQ